MLHGGKFFTYIADELPEIMRGFFPISAKREETFICGSSMGGYGALKIGLSRPERFGVIGSLSSGYTSYRGYISRVDDRGLSLQYLTFGETGLDEEDVETAEKARAIVRSGKDIRASLSPAAPPTRSCWTTPARRATSSRRSRATPSTLNIPSTRAATAGRSGTPTSATSCATPG